MLVALSAAAAPCEPPTSASSGRRATLLAASLGCRGRRRGRQPGAGDAVREAILRGHTLQLTDPVSILPALLLAIANGSMEEVAYRGAMLHWLTPSLGVRGALVAQAICFGAAHTGPISRARHCR